jgi:hypothetical protein
MSYSTILNLNSKYHTSDSASSSDFNISIGQSISIKQAVIKSVILPNSMYNIDTLNNKLRFQEEGVNYDILLTPGGYSITQVSLRYLLVFML